MNSKLIFHGLLICFIPLSCSHPPDEYTNQEAIDIFYVESTKDEYSRFPLIKPYEVVSLDDGETWSVELIAKPERISEINNPGHIKEVCVSSKIILLHSIGETIVQGQEVQEAWYAILSEQSIVKGFTNISAFNTFLNEQQLQNIEWTASETLFTQFDNTFCLPWIEGC
jgi:hypothetical protein